MNLIVKRCWNLEWRIETRFWSCFSCIVDLNRLDFETHASLILKTENYFLVLFLFIVRERERESLANIYTKKLTRYFSIYCLYCFKDLLTMSYAFDQIWTCCFPCCLFNKVFTWSIEIADCTLRDNRRTNIHSTTRFGALANTLCEN